MVSPPIEQVIPGAQLVVRYSSYCHHGIYAGGGRVIHYAGWIRGRRGLIEEVPLDEFSEGREFTVNLSPPDLIGGRAVVRRARSRLGERCYDLLENNCEHSARGVSSPGWARQVGRRSRDQQGCQCVSIVFLDPRRAVDPKPPPRQHDPIATQHEPRGPTCRERSST